MAKSMRGEKKDDNNEPRANNKDNIKSKNNKQSGIEG